MPIDFDTVVPRRGTGSLKWDKRPELDPFWVADMDFPSPPEVIAALRERVAHGIFGYALPHEGLVEAILDYLVRQHRTTVDPVHLLHLGGLVPALSLAARAVAVPGDAILTCTPVYPPFLGIHRDGDLELRTVPHVSGDEGWTFDWEALETTVTKRTRLFILSQPQNPLGRVFTEAEMVRLAEFCARHDLVLVSDEIHCDLILDETLPFFSALHLPAEFAERTITLLSPSKTYNIAGLGYAYAIIRDDRLRRRFTSAKGHTLAEINALSYFAAEAAYRHGDPWRFELLAYLRGNRDLIVEFVQRELPGLGLTSMEATYLAWLDFRPLEIAEPATLLEKEAGLFLSEGRAFGAPGHARLNFGCPRPLLAEALPRLREAVRAAGS